MSFPFRRILSPVDFEDISLVALEVAVQIARESDGTILLLNVVPMIIPPTDMPVYVDEYKAQEVTAKEKLRQIAAERLQGIKYELLTHLGEPASAIIRTAKCSAADLIVIAVHERHEVSRIILGSITESVLRGSACPVLCIRRLELDKNLAARWTKFNPRLCHSG